MITYFHRNKKAGYSINKVTQTIISKISDKKEFYVPYYGASLFTLLKNILYIYHHRSNNGINHITGDIHYGIFGLLGGKSVITIHDIGIVDDKESGFCLRVVYKWIWVKIPLYFATKVVCISDFTKKNVERFTSRRDIVVIHNAVDDIFETKIKDPNLRPYNILAVGTGRNKNLERTIKALEGIDCCITIIGLLSEDQKILLNTTHAKYVVKSNLTDLEVKKEYENTDIVTFVSLFEGFGMPIIEANKVGRPVITSDIPVLREVGGDSCLYVDPYDIQKIRSGFVELFEDEKLRKECVVNGLKNVKRFDVNIISQEWINLYKSL